MDYMGIDLSRFEYTNATPPVRVLDSRFVNGDRAQGIEHFVQLAPDGVALPAQWISDEHWKTLVGMAA